MYERNTMAEATEKNQKKQGWKRPAAKAYSKAKKPSAKADKPSNKKETLKEKAAPSKKKMQNKAREVSIIRYVEGVWGW